MKLLSTVTIFAICALIATNSQASKLEKIERKLEKLRLQEAKLKAKRDQITGTNTTQSQAVSSSTKHKDISSLTEEERFDYYTNGEYTRLKKLSVKYDGNYDLNKDFKTEEELTNLLLNVYITEAKVIQFGIGGEVVQHIALNNYIREGGGNESHFGLGSGKLEAQVTYYDKKSKRDMTAKLYLRYIDKGSLLNFNDETKQSFHNEHFWRADGTLNDVQFFSQISLQWKLGKKKKQHLVLNIGGVEEGVKALGTVDYYLSGPVPFEQTKMLDTGLQVKYWLGSDNENPLFYTSLSVIDGDRIVGDTNLFVTGKSEANSYPGYNGKVVLSPTNIFKSLRDYFGVSVGGLVTINDRGSYPGQKTIQDSKLVFTEIYINLPKGMKLNTRYSTGELDRNPEGQGYGNHGPLVTTEFDIVEAVVKNIPTKIGEMELYWQNSNMIKADPSIGDDGAIWSLGSHISEIEATTFAATIKRPFGLLKGADKVESYLNLSVTQYEFDADLTTVSENMEYDNDAKVMKLSLGFKF